MSHERLSSFHNCCGLVANGQATVALELHHKSPVTHLSVSSRRGKSQFVASRVQRVLKS